MDYSKEIAKIHQRLGVPENYAAARGLNLQSEATQLVDVEVDHKGKQHRLTPAATRAWQTMKQAAEQDRVLLYVGSGFRSVAYQTQLIEHKLQNERDIHDILKSMAAPGYSEHHTGQAIDIVTLDSAPFTEHFEQTAAFNWLTLHADRFGFTLSFPRDNPFGIIYEPWHWCFHDR